MEILDDGFSYRLAIMFKIDFIVWKFGRDARLKNDNNQV